MKRMSVGAGIAWAGLAGAVAAVTITGHLSELMAIPFILLGAFFLFALLVG